MFYSTDGAYVQGDIWRDMAFEAFFCKFNTPIVTVELQALELAGGIDAIDINADTTLPEGTNLLFEMRINNVWVPIESLADGATHPLTARPSVSQFRVTYVGSTDLMPALGLGATRSQVIVTRPATTFTHISDEQTPASAVTNVQLRLVVDGWDVAKHTLTVTLLRGAGFTTVETHDLLEDEVRPNEDGRLYRTLTFSGMTALSSYKIKIVGVTTDSHELFLINERVRIDGAA